MKKILDIISEGVQIAFEEAGYEVFSSNFIANGVVSENFLTLVSGVKYTIYIESQNKSYSGTFFWKE